MNRHRITRAVAAAAMVVALAASPAGAATTETTVTRGIQLDFVSGAASAACGFTIELHTVGMDVSIRHYDADGTLKAELLQQHYDGYLLNPANGKTVMSKVSGPVRWVFYDDGSFTETSSGSTIRTVPGAGLISGFIGHSRVTLVPTGDVDADGFEIYDVVEDIFNGQFLGNAGICDELS